MTLMIGPDRKRTREMDGNDNFKIAIEFVSNETQSIEKELLRLQIYVFDKLLCIS